MGKKHKRTDFQVPEPAPQGPLFDLRAKRSLAWGGSLLLVGFFCLARTDVLGTNWASWFSPLAIVLGYFLVALALFLPPVQPPAP